jgi:uncharacterized membrane protein YidH (DUF202 family)
VLTAAFAAFAVGEELNLISEVAFAVLLTITHSAFGDAGHRSQFEALSGPFGRYGGLALIFGGVGLIVLATARFVRTTRLLDSPEEHSAKGVRVELILSAGLVLLVASYTIYLALD